MLIKYCDLNHNVHLIEKVKDVSIYKSAPEDNDGLLETMVLDDFDFSKEIKTPCKVVHYADNGLKQLLVFNVAYICNDDGNILRQRNGLPLQRTAIKQQ